MKYFETLAGKLKELGIEKKQVDELVEFSKKEVPKEFVPSEKLTDVKTEFEAFKETAKEKDELINNLKTKAESVEEYENKIKELNTKVEEVENSYQQKLNAKTLDNKVNERISMMEDLNPKAKKAFKKLLDYEKISLDNENLIGFDEQAKSIKEENDYMTVKKKIETGDPAGGNNSNVDDESMSKVRAAMGLR